jgi:hypothetical protein
LGVIISAEFFKADDGKMGSKFTAGGYSAPAPGEGFGPPSDISELLPCPVQGAHLTLCGRLLRLAQRLLQLPLPHQLLRPDQCRDRLTLAEGMIRPLRHLSQR